MSTTLPRLLLLLVVTSALAACPGENAPAADAGPDVDTDAGPDEEAAALTITTVNENGDPVLARRVLVQPQPADAFWLEATAASCQSGAPPCSTWVVDTPSGRITERIAVAAERISEATPTESCQPFASSFVTVHPGTDDVPTQRVSLTLPSDATYCIDPDTFRSVINMQQDEEVDATDVLAVPEGPRGALTLSLVDQNGDPVPGTIAHWYYDPKSPAHDGEHPLRCADVRCETWVFPDDDVPVAGTVYLNATYVGPLNPFLQQGWLGYDGAPFTFEERDGALVPQSVTLTLRTDEEGAIGG